MAEVEITFKMRTSYTEEFRRYYPPTVTTVQEAVAYDWENDAEAVLSLNPASWTIVSVEEVEPTGEPSIEEHTMKML